MKCIPSTLSGRVVAAPSVVMEMDDVFEARITSGRVIRSREAKSALLAEASSKMASTMKSALARSSTLVPVWMRPMAAERSPAWSLPFSTSFARLLSIVARARSSAPSAASISVTSKPDCANTWAMPLPIVPAPTTPTRVISPDMGPSLSDREEDARPT